MIKRIAISILLIVFSIDVFSQTEVTAKLEKAGDELFNGLAYKDALVTYNKALKKYPSREALKLKIAESYRMLNDPKNAEKWYAQIIDQEQIVDSEHKLHYAETLSGLGRYDEAKKWYINYQQEEANDSRSERKIRGIENQIAYFKNVDYTTISLANFNSVESDFSPAFFNDGVVFVSGRKGVKGGNGDFKWDKSNFLDLFSFKDEATKSFFGKNINSSYHEGPMTFMGDGKAMIFTRSNYLNGKLGADSDDVVKLKLYTSQLEDGEWSEPISMAFNNDNYSVGHPTVSTSGNTLYFVSDMPGGYGKTDLYKSEFEDGIWKAPVNLGPGINTEGDELFPFIWEDTELYFASNGHGGLGGLDVFGINVKRGLDSKISNVGAPINSSRDDFGLIIDQVQKAGYFSSNRNEGLGNDDIYSFVSTRSLLSNYLVKGVISDKVSGELLQNVFVKLLSAAGEELVLVQTDENGRYSIPVDPDIVYKLSFSKEDYFDGASDLTTDVTWDKEEWEVNESLLKDSGFSLLGKVIERGSGIPIPGASIELIDNITATKVLEVATEDDGVFTYGMADKTLNDRISYQIKMAKEGYLGKTITFNSKLETPGVLDLVGKLDLSMDKIDIGTDVGKLIDIKPIYFDLGKYNIRSDASTELNKMVAIMIENPNLEIELGAHTDSRGTAVSNMRLSDKRAKASADYIISQGIDAGRIFGKGYGEDQIINRCVDGVKCSSAEHQSNRRTEFKITKY